MRNFFEKNVSRSGFSLAEVLVSLTISSLILVAGISLYRRAENGTVAVASQLGASRLGSEVLQYIAEDLDKIIAPGDDTRITVENKVEQHGYSTAKLTISKGYFDKDNKRQTFEEITWVASYDFSSADEGLILYRGHRGIVWEDKLLDNVKEDWEKELFIPICSGVTYFKIVTPLRVKQSLNILEHFWIMVLRCY